MEVPGGGGGGGGGPVNFKGSWPPSENNVLQAMLHPACSCNLKAQTFLKPTD